ncbi:MAG: winged helix DNA-binding domain-containing protein, partial [Mucilaginibacter polytrichastri]|nr:winged helix DNA-binding domain-containing protein [Mucilaginibacter polytrichastri]
LSWWSGLTLGEVRSALDLVRAHLIAEKTGDKIYYLKEAPAPGLKNESTYFLPAFDEFLVGYADRSASLHLKHNKNIITNNGMFFPTIIVNGQVTGLWKKTRIKETTGIEPAYFLKKNALKKSILKEASKQYAAFYKESKPLK